MFDKALTAELNRISTSSEKNKKLSQEQATLKTLLSSITRFPGNFQNSTNFSFFVQSKKTNDSSAQNLTKPQL